VIRGGFPAIVLACGLLVGLVGDVAAQPKETDFLKFVRAQATKLREQDRPPTTAEEWRARREMIRERLEAAWGGFPTEPCPLEPRKVGELQRDGYRIEKLLLQTMPDVWMPALAYVPESPGPHPAILNVHGHWKHAKVEPVVQSRCIGAVKLGFFVLCVDAFGAGERAIGKALGEYHGEMSAATLFPTGRPLSGIQVYENMRAVDYLQSRPEVDPTKIGITGASGGGNQTMYAGAWDERFTAVVPVCSVGNYQAYLGPACCMCEVVPGALTFTEEAGVLGLTAPRALMPCNTTRDASQFAIREARKSMVWTQEVYNVLGQPDQLYHATFHWHHDYHQPIREAMYGWMAKHLRGEGDGSPIAEPPHETVPIEELRLFPGESRPDDWLTLPRFAAREGRKLLAEHRWPTDNQGMPDRTAARERLINKLLGGVPESVPLELEVVTVGTEQRLSFVSEPGIRLQLRMPQPTNVWPQHPPNTIRLLLDLGGAEQAMQQSMLKELDPELATGALTLDLRATGELAQPGDKIGRAPDHNTAEWSLWIGRPLLGQWAWDVHRALRAIQARWPDTPLGQVSVIANGPAGLVALAAAAYDDELQNLVLDQPPSSYVSDVPYERMYLGVLVPGILRETGDIPHLAGLVRGQVTVLGGVDGGAKPLSAEQLRLAWERPELGGDVRVIDTADRTAVLKRAFPWRVER
jgi:hypothetical protein